MTAITATVVLLRRRWPAGLAAWVYYAIALGPVIGIVHSGHQLTNDRYSYLPGIGFALIVGAGVGAVVSAGAAGVLRPALVRAVIALAIVWLGGLAYLSAQQTQIWRDTESLWRYAIEVEPDCSLCHGNVGTYLMDHGYHQAAMIEFERVKALRPESKKVYFYLGYMYVMLGDFSRAVDNFKLYVGQYPNDAEGLNNLGAALVNNRRPKEALVAPGARAPAQAQTRGRSRQPGVRASRPRERRSSPEPLPRGDRAEVRLSAGVVRARARQPPERQRRCRAQGMGAPGAVRPQARRFPRTRLHSDLVTVAQLESVADAWPIGLVVVVGLFGLALGSFLNVVIARLPAGGSLLHPRSACPGCSAPLAWYDNIPVLSFVALRGRCRACGMRISWRYPIVEVITAAVLVLAYVAFGPSAEFLVACVLLRAHRDDRDRSPAPDDPDAIALPGIPVGLLINLATGRASWVDSGIGILLGGGLFLVIILASRGGMGGGDMKLGAMLGAFLGWKALLFALFVAIVLGGAIGACSWPRACEAGRIPFHLARSLP